MNEIVMRSGFARLRDEAATLWIFAATLLLSAFLLFSVQPIFAKMVLPKLGGSPSVWAISMCFFQAVLLAGYCYAWAINRFAPPRKAPLLHLALLAAAALALPFGLPANSEPPAGDAYLWLIGILTIGVGLPFFAVSANAPLLQAWFARTGHPQAQDPYFLYGASNLGSLAALLAYPVLIEPVLGLAVQARVWSSGFVLLAALIGACGLIMVMAGEEDGANPAAAAGTQQACAPVSWQQCLVWIGLAFVPSGLLVAFSSYVTTDVASAPFVWVIPLALFLATFILVFRDRPVISHTLMLTLQPAVVALTLTGLAIAGTLGWMAATVAGFAGFFVTTMVAHRELYQRRPASQHLTAFYLWMSLGGVLGGVFAAIMSPQIFNALFEFPLLLVLGMLCRPGLANAIADKARRIDALKLAGGGLITIVALMMACRMQMIPVAAAGQITLLVILAGGVLMLLTREQPLRQLALCMLTALALVKLPTAMTLGHSERSFFGVHRIVVEKSTDSDGRISGEARILLHGTTLHGIERIKDAEGRPITGRPVASSYYHPDSPMRRALEIAREHRKLHGGAFAAGIVGLGAGSMACYAQTSDRWRLYEIDPVVVKIARTEFSFLPRCLPTANIVIGDARLTLAKEPPGRFDYLLIDAFSSDSIPVHLLTREALQLYLDKLSPDGLLTLHISNRHLELESVAAALAGSFPGVHAAFVKDMRKATIDASPSSVMVISRSVSSLAPVLALPGARLASKPSTAVWTDDFSNVLAALIRNYW